MLQMVHLVLIYLEILDGHVDINYNNNSNNNNTNLLAINLIILVWTVPLPISQTDCYIIQHSLLAVQKSFTYFPR